MCKPISWVEYSENISVITNADTTTKDFIKLVKETGDKRDVCGHGFLRQYNSLTKGVNKEVNDFWNTEKLHPKIAVMVVNFDKYFSWVWEYADEDSLRDIVHYAPEKYKAKAFQALLDRKDSSENSLRDIVYYSPEKYKAKASQALLDRKDSSENSLRYIVYYSPEKYKAKAQAELKKRGL